jgi:hypothetical protein
LALLRCFIILWKGRFFGGEMTLRDDTTRLDDNLRLMTTSWMTAKPMTAVRMTLRDAD